MKQCIAIFLIFICLTESIEASNDNDVHNLFKKALTTKKRFFQVRFKIKISEQQLCRSFSDCGPTECCVLAHRGSSNGVCEKRPSLGDRCNLSASSALGCPCIAGTTCSKYLTYSLTSTRKQSFRCRYVQREPKELAER